jgi:hypothetical protein
LYSLFSLIDTGTKPCAGHLLIYALPNWWYLKIRRKIILDMNKLAFVEKGVIFGEKMRLTQRRFILKEDQAFYRFRWNWDGRKSCPASVCRFPHPQPVPPFVLDQFWTHSDAPSVRRTGW